MSSLYAKYVEERLGRKTIETEYGFMTYSINGKEFFVCDFYVLPSYRGQGKGKEIIAQAYIEAVNADCEFASAGVSVQAGESNSSLLFILKQGFKLNSANGDYIVLLKKFED